MELYASYSRFIDSQVTCVVNNQSCEGFRKNGFVLHKTENELAVAEENGERLKFTKTIDFLFGDQLTALITGYLINGQRQGMRITSYIDQPKSFDNKTGSS